jgi:hypothetical protein
MWPKSVKYSWGILRPSYRCGRKKICIVNCFLAFGALQKMQQGQHNARQGTHGKPEVLLVLDRASAAFISHPAKVSFRFPGM